MTPMDSKSEPCHVDPKMSVFNLDMDLFDLKDHTCEETCILNSLLYSLFPLGNMIIRAVIQFSSQLSF